MNPRVGFVTQVTMGLDEQLAFAGEAGFDYVEILMDGPVDRGALAEREETVGRHLAEGDLDLVVHLPFPTDIGSPYAGVRDGAVATQRRCLDVASDLGAEKAVLHPESSAWEVAWDHEDLRRHIDESVRELDAYGAERGVEICAENLFGGAYTIDTIDGLLAATDVSMTLDTGHARVSGSDAADTAEFVAEHGDRIAHVHLNDTRVPRDEHLPFGAGNVDFATILGAFDDDWSGTLSLEVATESVEYLRHSRAALDELLPEIH
ncbi:TIM barrel protein [Halobaculum sp. WSA2]|uniref:TIM barrel protein n=1 Tax=Halobaculum saliterrae TaxID=2073113 RepID=A0A6B0SXY0_9EURY|nr:sugar phosphate isomerase/epimerase family protein [Halobaculum saliterrae]MXR40820.1 TIM barrel protein [Halobaculum saliterrae]